MNNYLKYIKQRIERLTINIAQEFYARVAYGNTMDRYTSYQRIMEKANADIFREFNFFHAELYREARMLIAKRLEDSDMKLFKSKKAEQQFRTEICKVLTDMERTYAEQIRVAPSNDIDTFPV